MVKAEILDEDDEKINEKSMKFHCQLCSFRIFFDLSLARRNARSD